MSGRDLWKQYIISVILLFLTGYFFYGHIWTGFLLLPFMYWIRKGCILESKEKEKRQYLKMYGEFLQGVENGLTSGYSMEHAVLTAKKELERGYGKEVSIVKELALVEKNLMLHKSIDKCLEEWSEQKGLEEMKLFSDIVASGRQRGGDMNRIIRQTAEAISGRLEAEEEIQTMLSGKYLEYRIMCVMPLGIIAYIRFGSPEYFQVLYDNLPGIIFMTICLLLYVFAIIFGKKWMKIGE